jgi:hypothetical protein
MLNRRSRFLKVDNRYENLGCGRNPKTLLLYTFFVSTLVLTLLDLKEIVTKNLWSFSQCCVSETIFCPDPTLQKCETGTDIKNVPDLVQTLNI